MPVIIARWPNNSFSVIKAPRDWSAPWLFDALDQEGDPHATEVFIVGGRDFHIASDWTDDDKTLAPYPKEGSLTEWAWPNDVLDQWRRWIRGEDVAEAAT